MGLVNIVSGTALSLVQCQAIINQILARCQLPLGTNISEIQSKSYYEN